MSRIGKAIINIPAGVKVDVNGQNIKVEGPKGKLEAYVHELISINLDGNKLSFTRPNDEKFTRAIHGTTRALVANMVEGVTKGFQKTLEIVGVGYRVEQKDSIGEYGICIDDMKGKKFHYMIAGKYNGGEVPEGMVLYEIKKRNWAVFNSYK